MKKLAIPLIIIAMVIAFYEYSQEKQNVFVICIVVVLFMVGLMQLNTKIPSKFNEEENKQNKEND